MLLIHNAQVVFPSSEAPLLGYVAIEGERIIRTGQGPAPAELTGEATEVVDASGATLMPGVIDCHVHFREPGLTHKATMASESRAAAAGGVTSWIDMPNTIPPTTTLDAWEEKKRIAAASAVGNYAFFVGATSDNLGRSEEHTSELQSQR